MKPSRRREGRIGMPPPRRRKPSQAEPVQASASVPAELVKMAAVADVVSPARNKHGREKRKWNKLEYAQLVLQKIFRGRDIPEEPRPNKLTMDANKQLKKDYPNYPHTISRREVMRAFKVVRKRRGPK
jgi:hypothetical protein